MDSSDFSVQIWSDEDCEELIAEVLYKGEFCFLISQEEGLDRLEIELHARKDGTPWTFRLVEFEDVVQRVIEELRDFQRDGKGVGE